MILRQQSLCILLSLTVVHFTSSFSPTTRSNNRHHNIITSKFTSTSTSTQHQSAFTDYQTSQNPNANEHTHTTDPSKKSFSGVQFGDVLSGLDKLYPPDEMSNRNALSRTDGYWKYIAKGEEPPQTLVYGEFDFFFFADLIDKAIDLHGAQSGTGSKDVSTKTFMDIGSGTGRLVIGAAALHPQFKLCKGLEILPGIHDAAMNHLESCKRGESDESTCMDHNIVAEEPQIQPQNQVADTQHATVSSSSQLPYHWNPMLANNNPMPSASVGVNVSPSSGIGIGGQDDDSKASASSSEYALSISLDDNDNNSCESIPLAPIQFSCGSFDDPYEYIGDANIIFVFSTCFSEDMMIRLSDAIGRQCEPGTIVITTEYKLQSSGYIGPQMEPGSKLPYGNYEIDTIDEIDGYNWLVGGRSTAHVHRVSKSLWDGTGPYQRPQSLE